MNSNSCDITYPLSNSGPRYSQFDEPDNENDKDFSDIKWANDADRSTKHEILHLLSSYDAPPSINAKDKGLQSYKFPREVPVLS